MSATLSPPLTERMMAHAHQPQGGSFAIPVVAAIDCLLTPPWDRPEAGIRRLFTLPLHRRLRRGTQDLRVVSVLLTGFLFNIVTRFAFDRHGGTRCAHSSSSSLPPISKFSTEIDVSLPWFPWQGGDRREIYLRELSLLFFQGKVRSVTLSYGTFS